MTRLNAISFSGGELTPEFFGRFDDAKYQTGLALCRNFVVKPHGPVENRAGFAYVATTKTPAKKSRLIPFTFAQDQTVVIEIGAGYFRFYTQGAVILSGGSPLEVANSYAEADLFEITYTQSGDIVTLCHRNYAPAELKRLGATSWAFAAIDFSNPLTPPSNVTASAVSAGSPPGTPTLQEYVVTTVSNGGVEESIASADNGTGGGGTVVNSAYIYSVSRANPGVFLVGPEAAIWALNDPVFISDVTGMTQLNGNSYQVASVSVTYDDVGLPTYCAVTLKSGGVSLNTSTFGLYLGGGTIARTSGGSGGSKVLNNLFDTGAYNSISWTAVTGAERYNIYKKYRGLYGYIGSTTSLSFTDDNIAPDLSHTPPIALNPFVGTGNYPGAVGYFEQRRWFGGTINQPGNLWGTRTATEKNLSYSLPAAADDSVTFKVASRERNTVRHILPLDNMLLLSDAAEWRVYGPTNGAIVGDRSPIVKSQSYVGSSAAQPVVVNTNLIFAAARGGHVREMAYDDSRNGYITGDLSLRAPHLFDGFSIVQIAHAKAPLPIVWAISSSGKLLGMTYIPEQQIVGWHQHDTAFGTFESCCTVAEGGEDVLYVVTRRQLPGGGYTRFIERQASRLNTDPNLDFFVDAGITMTYGSPVSLVSGLTWLEGREVAILADGVPQTRKTVASGAVSLDAPARNVTVGLPITADVQTLPIAAQIEGYAQGRSKNVNKVWVRVYRSSQFSAGPSFTDLTETRLRTDEPMGTPIRQRNEEVELMIDASWNDTGQVCIRHNSPLPLTVLAITPDVVFG